MVSALRRRLRRVIERQRTILGIVLREVQHKLASATTASLLSLHRLQVVMARDERIRTQQTKDKNKL